MKTIPRLVLLTAFLIPLGQATMASAELKVGDEAPDVTLKGSDGKEYRLADMKGKTAFLIAWFPKAFTGG